MCHYIIINNLTPKFEILIFSMLFYFSKTQARKKDKIRIGRIDEKEWREGDIEYVFKFVKRRERQAKRREKD
jgi:hypothetical protein